MAVALVISHHDVAVQLRCYEMSAGEHASFSQNVGDVPTARRAGQSVTILPHPAVNRVDLDFWNAWSKQNEKTPAADHLSFAGIEE